MPLLHKDKAQIENVKFRSIEKKYNGLLSQFFAIETAVYNIEDRILLASRVKDASQKSKLKQQNLSTIPKLIEGISLLCNALEELKSTTSLINHFLIPFDIKNDLFNQIDELHMLSEKLEDFLDKMIVANRNV